MTEKAKKMCGVSFPYIIGVLTVLGTIWASSARIQIIDNRSVVNKESISEIKGKIVEVENRHEKHLKTIRDDIKLLIRYTGNK